MNEAKPPPLSLWVRELPHIAQIWSSRFRKAHPIDTAFRPDGPLPPLMVIPGIMSSDYATSLLRRTLQQTGYPAYASQLGFVTGVTDTVFAKAEARLEEIHKQEGAGVVLLGWSLGGLFARVLAQRHPEMVRMVVTLGSPFSGDRHANNAWRLYNAINDHKVDAPKLPDDPSAKPAAHTVAVWSMHDGVVAPECARGKSGERDVAILMNSRHFAFGSDRRCIGEIVEIIAQELAMRA